MFGYNYRELYKLEEREDNIDEEESEDKKECDKGKYELDPLVMIKG